MEVTIDDGDSKIVYNGLWEDSSLHTSALNIGPGHSLSATGGTATFKFIGVAAPYLAPKWPYAVNSMVTLDGESTVADIRDYSRSMSGGGPETFQSDVVWSRNWLRDTEHTLVILRGPLFGGLYTVLDALRYTTSVMRPIVEPPSKSSLRTSAARPTNAQPTLSLDSDDGSLRFSATSGPYQHHPIQYPSQSNGGNAAFSQHSDGAVGNSWFPSGFSRNPQLSQLASVDAAMAEKRSLAYDRLFQIPTTRVVPSSRLPQAPLELSSLLSWVDGL